MIGNWFVLCCFVCGTFALKVTAIETTDDQKLEFASTITDYCHSNPCLNNGTCIPVEESYGCICDEPFYGMHCENDPCTPNPCVPGRAAACQVVGIDFNCTCVEPYFGKICQNVYDTTDADITEVWTTASTTYKDVTTEEHNTTNEPFPSSSDFDECYCGENSIGCRLDRQANKICSCESGFAQRRETEKCSRSCQSNLDCHNDGICARDGNEYFCVCPDVYIGDNCEIDVCRNLRYECPSKGAECRRKGTVGVCECPGGKTMSPNGYCEDSCSFETCIHGTCVPNKYNYYECKCYYGFYGRNCDLGPNTQNDPYAWILVILASVILFFSIGSIIAGCWVKKLRKKIEEKSKQTVQP